MDWIVNMIRAGMRPGANTLAGKIQSDYAQPPAPAAPHVPVATSETGVRSLERQMWPEFFDNGVPKTEPYRLAEDPMTAGGDYSGALPTFAPMPPSRPQGNAVAAAMPSPVPPKRPLAHTAPAAPQQPQQGQQPYIPPSETAWMDPATLSRQNAASIGGSQPQAAYASMNGGGGSSISPPGGGLLGFLGSGAVPAYKQSALTPSDFQGPALPNDMSGKRVGVVEGSVADQFQQSPVFKMMSLLGGGGFG